MNYDQIALGYSEKYGIIEYKVSNNKMIYHVKCFEAGWEIVEVVVNLDTLEESRKYIN